MSATVTIPTGVELCHLPSPFGILGHGRGNSCALDGAVLAYERQGARDLPVVVVLGGISANRHVAAHREQPQDGWWQGVVGAGSRQRDVGIDTEHFQVLSFDWLGGAGNSTGPANFASAATSPAVAFPDIGAADQARALWALCDALRIESLHAIVGSSYGGMVAQHAAQQQPQRCSRLVAIAAADRSHAQARAWRHVQRRIVELGCKTGSVRESLALARSLAMAGYRSPEELQLRFGTQQGEPGQLPAWLDARGDAFAEQWRADEFLCLNRSIDEHDIDARCISVATYLLAFDSDQLVPPCDVRDFALRLPNLCAHRQRRSLYGHDAFLKETAAVSAFVREALQ